MKKVVFSIGRFNPPTRGHAKLITEVIKTARTQRARPIIFTTMTQDESKNPLGIEQKLHYLRQFFPGVEFIPVANAYGAVQHLGTMDLRRIVFISGSDRADMSKMFARACKNGDLNSNIRVFSTSIARNPELEDIRGISGTKARECVKNNDFESFVKMCPRGNQKTKQNMFNDIQEKIGKTW